MISLSRACSCGGFTIRTPLVATLVLGLLVPFALLPATAASAGVTVVAAGVSFAPAALTIAVGTTVTWSAAVSSHTVTTDDGGTQSTGGVANDPNNSDGKDDTWNADLPQGSSFAHTFASAGSFTYHCEFHHKLGMVGVIVVVPLNTTRALRTDALSR